MALKEVTVDGEVRERDREFKKYTNHHFEVGSWKTTVSDTAIAERITHLLDDDNLEKTVRDDESLDDVTIQMIEAIINEDDINKANDKLDMKFDQFEKEHRLIQMNSIERKLSKQIV
ncbi:MAG: hypothetical protein N4A44_01555 [Alphaproteobacteria bacterium]|jgi:hypothetical protein|nr:hypothetical protein [Alphaproteobacteria bacterium]